MLTIVFCFIGFHGRYFLDQPEIFVFACAILNSCIMGFKHHVLFSVSFLCSLSVGSSMHEGRDASMDDVLKLAKGAHSIAEKYVQEKHRMSKNSGLKEVYLVCFFSSLYCSHFSTVVTVGRPTHWHEPFWTRVLQRSSQMEPLPMDVNHVFVIMLWHARW